MSPQITKGNFRITELPNGIRIATQSMPGMHNVSVNVSVGVGSGDENEHEQGISHAIEHSKYLGTKNRTQEEIALAFVEIGARDNACTSKNVTQYHAQAQRKHVGNVVEILSDVIKNSTYPLKNFKSEMGVIHQEILMYSDDPKDKTDDLVHTKLFPGHPLGKPILGTKKSVASFKRADLIAFDKKHYRPDNMVITAAGNIDHDEFVAMVKEHFGDIPKSRERYTKANRPQKIEFDPENYHGGDIRKKRDLDQVQIMIGTLLNTPQDSGAQAVLEVYTDILGSRLFRKVRSEHSLTYRISANAVSYKGVSELLVDSSTSGGKAKKLSRLVCEEIAEMANGVTPKELEIAKTRLISDLAMDYDDTEHVAEEIGEQLLTTGKYCTVKEAIAKIKSVTLEDVNNLAKEVASSKLVVATLGDNKNRVPSRKKLEEILQHPPEPGGHAKRIQRGENETGRGA